MPVAVLQTSPADPRLTWLQFVGEECGREDVAAVDEPWSRALDATLGVHHAQDWTAKTRTWTVKSCTGQAVDLIPGVSQSCNFNSFFLEEGGRSFANSNAGPFLDAHCGFAKMQF